MPEGTGVVLRPGVWLAFGLLGLILLLPLPEGLTPQGRSALVLLAFGPALWLTAAVSHEVSAILIAWLTALVLGLTADPASPQGAVLGTTKAPGAALQGFANPALALLADPLFIAAAMTMTGLDRRIALLVLIRLGSGARGILAGVILFTAILSFVVPSAPGRMAALVPIILGILAAVGLERRSRFGGLLMIAAADAASIWNIGLKTAAPQNIVGLGFVEAMLGLSVTWPQWFATAGPYAAIMSVVLYGLLLWLSPPEVEAIPGAREKIRQALSALGSMTVAEKRLGRPCSSSPLPCGPPRSSCTRWMRARPPSPPSPCCCCPGSASSPGERPRPALPGAPSCSSGSRSRSARCCSARGRQPGSPIRPSGRWDWAA
jgi:sodium-dependent dicarboxylate transporter 2/3/5